MKTLSFSGILFLLVMIMVPGVNGQGTFPQGFNYQAIARNATGTAIAATQIKVQIEILSDTVLNTVVWREEHTVTTNAYGLMNLVIGRGTRTGGSAATFDVINWSATQMFIGVSVKNPPSASVFTPMGKARLWSVPYAMLSASSIKDLSSPFVFNGDTVWLAKNLAIGASRPLKAQLAVVSKDDASDDPLFEVRRKDGQPIFTVYNDAVEINVPFPGKGSPSRGGFAIGGFDETKGTYVADLFRVTPDSVRIYINNSPTLGKGSPSRGGFAIGGFDETKATLTELMRVTHDSTRIYTNESSNKGFAVGYLSSAAIRTENFMKINKLNYFIGHGSGRAVTTGEKNTFLGFESGLKITTGSANVFIGQESGYNTTQGIRNIFIGYRAGYSNIGVSASGTIGHDNIYIGTNSGLNIQTGEHNTLIGSYSGYNGSGTKNTFVGAFTGFNATGLGNVFVGVDAGRNNSGGGSNVFLGAIAGNNNSGDNNTFLGYGAGWTGSANTGSNNVFIGNMAGAGQTGSNMLFIDNSSTTTPLLYGDFANDRLRLNANVGINYPGIAGYGLIVETPSSQTEVYALYVVGDAYAFVWTPSDIKFKENIEPLSNSLDRILSLRGYSYNLKTDEFPERKFNNRKQTGLLAQEVEQIFPEMVKEDENGNKAVAYHQLIPVMVEAIKEQQKTIESMKTEMKTMDERIKKLEEMVKALTDK